MPEIACSSSDWPLPATPAMPTISPARTSKRDILDHIDAAAVADRQVLDREHDVAWRGGTLVDMQKHPAADHQLGKLLHRGLSGGAGGDHLAAPHHGDLIRHRHDLAQLVGDQQDGFAFGLELLENPEQVIGLGGVSTPVGSSRIRISAPR
jgi:hypothetical protein